MTTTPATLTAETSPSEDDLRRDHALRSAASPETIHLACVLQSLALDGLQPTSPAPLYLRQANALTSDPTALTALTRAIQQAQPREVAGTSILFHVTDPAGRHHATVSAVPSTKVRESLVVDGRTVEPDWPALRAALPHRWRKAFDRASRWFPATLLHPVLRTPNRRNAVTLDLRTAKGEYITSLHLSPYRNGPTS